MSYALLAPLHIASAIAALVLGSLIFPSRKGTYRHKAIGYAYLVAMLTLNVTALSIFKLTGTFGAFHIAAIISLATVIAGFIPVAIHEPSHRWLELHLNFMAWSYLGLLAGGISEMAVRVPSAPFWPAVAAGSLSVFVGGAYVLARNQRRLVTIYGTTRRL